MKKILSLLFAICLILNLSACSTNDDEYILTFFDALDNTLDIDSGHIEGTVTSRSDDSSTMNFDLFLNQTESIELALSIGLEANNNIQDDFIDFYIKDGKTYLKYLETTSQSLAENIGIDPTSKLSVSNPFLDFTDDELKAFFSSAKKDDNTYTFELNTTTISSLLDSLGSIVVQDATLIATIENDYLESISLQITGVQTVNEDQASIDITIDALFDQINSLDHIDFPDNLDSY